MSASEVPFLERWMKQQHGQFQLCWEADSAPWRAPEFFHSRPLVCFQVSISTTWWLKPTTQTLPTILCTLSFWSNSICASAPRLLLLWYCACLCLSHPGTNHLTMALLLCDTTIIFSICWVSGLSAHTAAVTSNKPVRFPFTKHLFYFEADDQKGSFRLSWKNFIMNVKIWW